MAVSYPLAVAVILATTAGIWVGSSWLETASDRLSAYYGLPAVVQGSIVAAIGSSFPELASVVFAALAGSFELGVGAIVGSAIFNVLVIPALAGLATDTPVEVNRTLVYKEAQFYMLAISVLLITFALAVIYNPAEGGPLFGRITVSLAVLPLALYGLYLFIQFQDTVEHVPESVADVDLRRQWASLLAGLVLILVAVERLVHQVETIGTELGLSQFLLGAIIVAAVTSLPDAVVSVKAAQGNRDVASLANVLGSNTFDLLVAIPVGVLIVGSATVDFAIAVPMFGVLTAATILLFVALRTDMTLTHLESYLLLGVYLGFVAWILAEVTGMVTGILPT